MNTEDKFQGEAAIFQLLADDLESMLFEDVESVELKVDRGLAVLLLDAVIEDVLERMPAKAMDGIHKIAFAARSGEGIRMRALIQSMRKQSALLERESRPD
ncbi:MAG: hypothetical protein KJ645_14795 [Planctomycetes bacterium]|nr:hypothetical protein [Planctomycetota bacterium]